jgi:predicted DNA-binding transcriptional regulator YafY
MPDPLQPGRGAHHHDDGDELEIVTFRHPDGRSFDPRTLSDEQAAGLIAAMNALTDLPQTARDLYAVLLTKARLGDTAADKLGADLAAARAKRGSA